MRVIASKLALFLLMVWSFLIFMTALNFDRLPRSIRICSSNLCSQKLFFQSQKNDRQAANNKPKSLLNLHMSVVPEISCPTMVRVGNVIDGGKWTCNPWKLGSDCVVYSLGVGNDVSFEMEIANLTEGRCSQHSFDPNGSFSWLFSSIENSNFHPWKLSNETDENNTAFTLPDIMTKLGHKFVDFLKMDIEGYEYDVLPSVLKIPPLFCQLLIEIHSKRNAKELTEMPQKWANLLKLIREHQYLMFSKEANPDCATCAYEYSFIHRNCAKRFGILPEEYQSNF